MQKNAVNYTKITNVRQSNSQWPYMCSQLVVSFS